MRGEQRGSMYGDAFVSYVPLRRATLEALHRVGTQVGLPDNDDVILFVLERLTRTVRPEQQNLGGNGPYPATSTGPQIGADRALCREREPGGDRECRRRVGHGIRDELPHLVYSTRGPARRREWRTP